MNWKKLIAGTLIFGSATVIFLYLKKQYQLITDSCIKFAGVRNVKINMQDFRMTLLLAYLNKSEISVELIEQFYEVYVNDILASTVSSKIATHIPAQDKANLKLEMAFNPKNLLIAGLQNINQLIFNQDELMIRITGTMKTKAGLITANVPFEYADSLANMSRPSDTPVKC